MSEKRDPRDERDDHAERDDRAELMNLAAIAAHQLRSPLGTIQSVLSTIVGGFLGPVDPRQRRLLEQAATSCTNSMKLVGDLLRLRNLDRLGAADLIPVHVPTVFDAAVDRVREAAEQKQVRLAADVSAAARETGWIRAEPGVLAEILHVLLDNAIKYTPADGHVTAHVSVAPGAGGEPAVLVEVADTGIGIPPEDYPRLFTEFFRASNAAAARQHGTGLGLSFAARAVRLLEGRIDLGPAPSGGVRAELVFRACAPAEGGIAPSGGAGGADPARREVTQRLVVIGGVSAGSKFAAKAMRLDPDAEVTIIERGQAMAYAGCGLPYYISGAVREQREMTGTPLGEERDSTLSHEIRNARVMNLTEAIAIDRAARTVRTRRILDGGEALVPYDKLVLATGARPVVAGIENVDLEGVYTLSGVRMAEGIKAELASHRAQDIVLVGAGWIGSDLIGPVAHAGARLSLVERKPSIGGIVDRELALLVQRYVEQHGVKVYTGVPAVRLEGAGRVQAVVLADGRRLPCDFVILAPGREPNTDLAARAGLALGASGAIAVDAALRTSDPDIFAIGDCAESRHRLTGREGWFPTGAVAVKQGRVAAINACGGAESFPGHFASRSREIFEYTLARTGFGEDEARLHGFDPVVALVPSLDSMHYMPFAKPIKIKLIADRATGRVLGAQGIGAGHVAKRIDIVTVALASGMGVDELSNLDLGFSPPHSLPLDSVLAAANVIRNKIAGLVEGISPLALEARLAAGERPFLLDVRTPPGFREKRLRGSVNVPLGSLRGRLHEVPRDREVVIVSHTGLKSYEAALILRHRGYERALMLDGGLAFWPYALDQE